MYASISLTLYITIILMIYIVRVYCEPNYSDKKNKEDIHIYNNSTLKT